MTEYLLVHNTKEYIEMMEQTLKALRRALRKNPDLMACTGMAQSVASSSIHLVSTLSQWKGLQYSR